MDKRLTKLYQDLYDEDDYDKRVEIKKKIYELCLELNKKWHLINLFY